LGVTSASFRKWLEDNEALMDAYKRGRKRFTGDDSGGFIDYVYKMLPEKLQVLWDKIKGAKGKPGEINFLLADKGDKVKKQLFMQAWCSCNFNPSRACQMINLSPSIYKRWLDDDDFKELISQIDSHKKNFFEECLVKSAKAGEVAAILFANRTLNRDRGYGDKAELEITGNLNHRHQNVLNFDELGLPIELQKQIMHYYRLHKDKKNGISGVLDYEEKEGVFVPVSGGSENESADAEDEKT
jgi:hypothetical protein